MLWWWRERGRAKGVIRRTLKWHISQALWWWILVPPTSEPLCKNSLAKPPMLLKCWWKRLITIMMVFLTMVSKRAQIFNNWVELVKPIFMSLLGSNPLMITLATCILALSWNHWTNNFNVNSSALIWFSWFYH